MGMGNNTDEARRTQRTRIFCLVGRGGEILAAD